MGALIYFAVFAVFFVLMMRFGCGAHVTGHGHGHAERETPKSGVDPVCGMTVRADSAKPSVHGGKIYYFCSQACRERFESSPELYLGGRAGQGPKDLEHAHG